MGILDGLLNISPERAQGLLGFASQALQLSGPSRVPIGAGQILGAGLQGYQQGADAYRQQQAQEEQARQVAAMRQLQMRNMQGDVEEQDRARAESAAILEAARGSLVDGQLDQNALLSKISAINPLKAVEISRSMAKAGPEYDTTPQIVNGPDGKPMLVQLSKTAAPRVLDGFTPREKAELLNLGGKSVAVNLADLKPGETFQRTMTPGEIATDRRAAASNAITMRGQDLADRRAREGLSLQAQKEKAPTEFQGKSAAFGLRATESDKIISSLEGKYSPTSINAKAAIGKLPLIGGVLEAGANLTMTDTEQRAEQAQRDFVNAILRQESGAAIGQDEFNNARKQYFPQPGDGAAVVQQKKRNRALAIQGLQSNAGRAAMTAPGAQPAAAPAGGVKFLGFE